MYNNQTRRNSQMKNSNKFLICIIAAMMIVIIVMGVIIVKNTAEDKKSDVLSKHTIEIDLEQRKANLIVEGMRFGLDMAIIPEFDFNTFTEKAKQLYSEGKYFDCELSYDLVFSGDKVPEEISWRTYLFAEDDTLVNQDVGEPGGKADVKDNRTSFSLGGIGLYSSDFSTDRLLAISICFEYDGLTYETIVVGDPGVKIGLSDYGLSY